jgi:hypothetical protein
MRQKAERHQDAAERAIKDIRRQTRKRYSSEEKIRIVLAGHCQTNLSGPAKGAGLKRSGRQLTPLG